MLLLFFIYCNVGVCFQSLNRLGSWVIVTHVVDSSLFLDCKYSRVLIFPQSNPNFHEGQDFLHQIFVIFCFGYVSSVFIINNQNSPPKNCVRIKKLATVSKTSLSSRPFPLGTHSLPQSETHTHAHTESDSELEIRSRLKVERKRENWESRKERYESKKCENQVLRELPIIYPTKCLYCWPWHYQHSAGLSPHPHPLPSLNPRICRHKH